MWLFSTLDRLLVGKSQSIDFKILSRSICYFSHHFTSRQSGGNINQYVSFEYLEATHDQNVIKIIIVDFCKFVFLSYSTRIFSYLKIRKGLAILQKRPHSRFDWNRSTRFSATLYFINNSEQFCLNIENNLSAPLVYFSYWTNNAWASFFGYKECFACDLCNKYIFTKVLL